MRFDEIEEILAPLGFHRGKEGVSPGGVAIKSLTLDECWVCAIFFEEDNGQCMGLIFAENSKEICGPNTGINGVAAVLSGVFKHFGDLEMAEYWIKIENKSMQELFSGG